MLLSILEVLSDGPDLCTLKYRRSISNTWESTQEHSLEDTILLFLCSYTYNTGSKKN